jgi:hypothetical protein
MKFCVSLNLRRPLLGGSLANPQKQFPKVFGGRFWQEFPYFLPCLAVAVIVFLIFLATFFFLKEVNAFVCTLEAHWS